MRKPNKIKPTTITLRLDAATARLIKSLPWGQRGRALAALIRKNSEMLRRFAA